MNEQRTLGIFPWLPLIAGLFSLGAQIIPQISAGSGQQQADLTSMSNMIASATTREQAIQMCAYFPATLQPQCMQLIDARFPPKKKIDTGTIVLIGAGAAIGLYLLTR